MTMTLQEISDRMEIQDLLVKYSYAIDTRDFEALDDVFTPDAWIDYTVFGGTAGNLTDTKKFLTDTMPMFRSFQHMVSTSQITIDGDTARVKTICHNPMVMPVGEDEVQVFYCGLWYVDDMVRTADGWRITKRVEEKSYVHNMPGIGDS
ncbi:MAG: nuclear transport factor 2 family protein [Acidimicrobiales bacterium]|jgi:3-phenylpropionate/cinnamic acid dioxygenase small subunit|nr:nuclear transport factor 2 family protein [Acidimicrobiales bacterium]